MMKDSELQRLEKLTVMLVDDEPANLLVLEQTLMSAGYRIVAFPDGESALAAALSEPPDLVLMDVRMPAMDGFEICRRFKASDELKDIHILFISALADCEAISSAFICGAVDYITKPFRELEVLARVRTHLSLKIAYDDLARQHADLLKLQAIRETLVNMLVHDMRVPLQVILSNLELVYRAVAGLLKSEDCEGLDTAMYFVRVMGRMVSAVVDVGRLEAATIPVQFEQSEVASLIEVACAQAIPLLNRTRVRTTIFPNCAPVRCDKGLSVRVIANLLDNALKYSPEGSPIVLDAKPTDREVRFEVRSQGPEIPDTLLKKIFDKYVVGSLPSGDVRHSSGLGLAFCKLAVESQGGGVGVESVPGYGNTFWFTLPHWK